MRALPLVALLLAAPAVLAQPDRAAVHDALDALLTDLHDRGLFDGALVAGRGDTVLYARGFGLANAEADVLFTPRTPADGGSLAKTFTAAALLRLQEEGRLHLDDPVRQHLPAYPYPGTTLRHLLSHTTGGLPDYDYFWARVDSGAVLTNAILLDVLAAHRPPLPHPPGTRFVYDSAGFDLAALVVERVAGQPYEAFLREWVFEPLGMDSAFARPARFADWPGVRTLSYRRDGDAFVVFDVWDREGFHGGSNLYFSADDLFRWAASFTTRPLLGADALAEGLRPTRLADGRTTGLTLLSWYADADDRRFQYPGVLQGFHAVAYWDAGRRHAFGLVTNSNLPQGLRPRLVAAVAEILAMGRAPAIALSEAAPLGDDVPGAVAGTYALDDGRTVRLDAEADRLFARVDGGAAYRVFPVDAATLYVPGLDAWLTFEDAVDGRFRRLHWTTVFHPAAGERTD